MAISQNWQHYQYSNMVLRQHGSMVRWQFANGRNQAFIIAGNLWEYNHRQNHHHVNQYDNFQDEMETSDSRRN